MRKIFYLFSAFFILWHTPVMAEVSINATVDKTEATLEDMIELTVTVYGLQSSQEPELPPLNDFQVQSGGTSSSIRIINGQMSASIVHTFGLLPKKTGEFTVGPVILRHKGQIYQSQPFKIKITAAASGPSSSEDNEGLFITGEVSNTRPYLHEQIMYAFKFYRKVQTANPKLQLSNFDKFRKEELGQQRDYEKVVNGQHYLVTELRFALFPTSTGKVVIEPSTLQIDVLQASKRRHGSDPFDSFFNSPFFGNNVVSKTRILRSKPIELEVLPVPESGRPDDYKNIVGEFNITSNMSKKELKVGETTTLTVKITGDGNVKDINLPSINTSEFKVYDDRPEYTKSPKDDRLFGQIVLKRSLVPLHEGEFSTPEIEIPYFDTKKKRYEILRAEPSTLKVIPSGEEEKLQVTTMQPESVTGTRVKMLANDLMDIHANLDLFEDQAFSYGQIFLCIILFVSPFMGFGYVAYYSRHHEMMRGNIGYLRRRTAYKKGLKKLGQIKKLVQDKEPKEFYKELSAILREYIGDKLNMKGTAFTSVDVEQRLVEKGFPQELITDIKAILERCELAQYTAGAQFSDSPDELLKMAGQLISQMEGYL